MVNVLRRTIADRAHTALALDQGLQLLRSQPEGALEVPEAADLAAACLAVRRQPIGLSDVLVPLGQGLDRVASSAVLVTGGNFDAAPHRLPQALTLPPVHRRATTRTTRLAVHLQTVSIQAVVTKVRDRLLLTAVRALLEQFHSLP